MNRKLKDEDMDILFRGILKLSTVEECYDFFEDLCTAKELEEMSRRAVAAKLLYDKHSYNDVKDRTGLSTATISRVSRCIQDNDDGYVRILERIAEEDSSGGAEK